jgi:hypothetical protein
MNYYEIVFPGECGQHVTELWSESQIIESYWPYWSGRMKMKFENPELTHEMCIEDWCTVHWAVKVPEPEWKKQINAGAEIHSDKGYEESTWEKYEEFVKKRNYPIPGPQEKIMEPLEPPEKKIEFLKEGLEK